MGRRDKGIAWNPILRRMRSRWAMAGSHRSTIEPKAVRLAGHRVGAPKSGDCLTSASCWMSAAAHEMLSVRTMSSKTFWYWPERSAATSNTSRYSVVPLRSPYIISTYSAPYRRYTERKT